LAFLERLENLPDKLLAFPKESLDPSSKNSWFSLGELRAFIEELLIFPKES
jgi:hypothetical protein